MNTGYEIIKGQKFEIGRTINPFKCDCEPCDFLNCPKKNYVPRTRPRRPTVEQFIECYADEILRDGFINYDLLNEFMECFLFPKGTYWNPAGGDVIQLVSFTRSGRPLARGSVNYRTGMVWNFDFSQAQEKLACRISKAVKKVSDFTKDRKER